MHLNRIVSCLPFLTFLISGYNLYGQESKVTVFSAGSAEYGRGLEKKVIQTNEDNMIVRQELYYRADKRLVREISVYDNLGVRTELEYNFTETFIKTNGYDRELHSWNKDRELVEYFYTTEYSGQHGKIRQVLEYRDRKLISVSTWWNEHFTDRFGSSQTIVYNDDGDIAEKHFFFAGDQAAKKGEKRYEYYKDNEINRIEIFFSGAIQETLGESQIHRYSDTGSLEQIVIIFPDSVAKQKGKKQIIFYNNEQKPVKYEIYNKQNFLLSRRKLD